MVAKKVSEKSDQEKILADLTAGKRLGMYIFKLQSVLDHRQLIEDNIKKELAEIRQLTVDNQNKLEILKEKEMNTIQALRKEQAKGLASDGVVAYHAFLTDLSKRMIKQQQQIDDIREQESAKQNELLEAMKKRQILEKLKDQGMDRYDKSILKKERAFIDEIAVNQFVRSSQSDNGDEK